MGALDAAWVARYARGPSASTVKRAISLHTNIRELIGVGDYETLLQGSYKNDTALAEMNDVDILAIRRDVTKRGLKWLESVAWEVVFKDIERRIQSDQRYAGKWSRQDKCVTIETGVRIDIVPAVAQEDPAKDPIVIHSFRTDSEKKNWPRRHHENGAAKNQRTSGAFKSAVRLFKRWARAHFPGSKIAPSYYLESLLYSLDDRLFVGEPAGDFLRVADAVLARHHVFGGYNLKALPRIAGEGDLLQGDEWSGEAFGAFLAKLRDSVPHAEGALMQDSPNRARAAWRMAFAGHEP